MNLNDLDNAITRWADRTYISVYALRQDTELMILLLQGRSKERVLEHLHTEYPEYFEEEEN